MFKVHLINIVATHEYFLFSGRFTGTKFILLANHMQTNSDVSVYQLFIMEECEFGLLKNPGELFTSSLISEWCS